MKILQVGSFLGNIGDNANHRGFREWFGQHLCSVPEWLEFEIREVFRGSRRFDEAFVELANRCELLIVGGGNFFELWVENSPTGTSFSIEPDLFAQITCPVFFNSLGVDDGMGVGSDSVDRFERFIALVLRSPKNLLSVRNDGSLETIARVLPFLSNEDVVPLADGGFLAQYQRPPRPTSAGLRLGVNLAGDMLSRRFPGGTHLEFEGFLNEITSTLVLIHDAFPSLETIFYPHIFSDLGVYAELLKKLPDRIRREKVVVEAYGAGDKMAERIFSSYCGCDLVLGMRFHANVIPIAHHVATIGLACYPQIAKLYHELDADDACVDVTVPGCSQALFAKAADILSGPGNTLQRRGVVDIRKTLAAHARGEQRVHAWLAKNGLVA